MNKYQEALTNMAIAIKVAYTIDNEEVPKPIIESTALLQELVNKATPKKPIVKSNNGMCSEFRCSNCNDRLYHNQPYCEICGGKVDWNE